MSEKMSKMTSQEIALKKKLQVFLADLVKLGTTQGFKHFSCYIRGKEELIISVKNNFPSSTSTGPGLNLSQPSSRKQSLRPTDSLNSACLPYDKTSLTLSYNTQVGLSGMTETGVGLPPASPSELESQLSDDVTNFMIAGYSRYSCPYVWIRSNHERLMKVAPNAGREKDSPLRLKSTARWQDGDVYVYEVVAELVKLSMYPAPRNPFEVDFAYFRNLTQPFQVLASSAMMTFLDKIITHAQDSCSYSRKVFQEHQLLSQLHFTWLYNLAETGDVPILKQMKQQQDRTTPQSSRRQQRSSPSSYPSSRYPTSQPPPGPSAIQSTTPVHNGKSVLYGQGSRGAFPGGFDRMPAPSMF